MDDVVFMQTSRSRSSLRDDRFVKIRSFCQQQFGFFLLVHPIRVLVASQSSSLTTVSASQKIVISWVSKPHVVAVVVVFTFTVQYVKQRFASTQLHNPLCKIAHIKTNPSLFFAFDIFRLHAHFRFNTHAIEKDLQTLANSSTIAAHTSPFRTIPCEDRESTS
jgi:hypothetical protein